MIETSLQIPAWNCERFVEAAVKSALANFGPGVETLVRDDGSTDGTFEKITALAKTFPALRVDRNRENMGAARTMQMMAESTDAEFVMVIGADDILLPGWADFALGVLKRHPEAAGVYGKLRHVDEDLRDLGRVQGGGFSRVMTPFATNINHGGMLVRRAAMLDAGGYMETGEGRDSVSVDGYLWNRMSVKWDFLFSDNFCCLYRQHASQMSSPDKAARRRRCDAFVRRSMLESNPPLAKKIRAFDADSVADSEKKHAALLCGILCFETPMSDPAHEKYLDAAERLAPSDFGVYYRKFALMFETGRLDEALANGMKLAAGFPGDNYATMMGCDLCAKALARMGKKDDAEFFRKKFEALKEKFASFPLLDGGPPSTGA